MMMKKLFVFPVVLFLMAGLILTGCDDTGNNSNPNNEPTGDLVDYTVIAATGILNTEDTTLLRFAFTKKGENYSIPGGGLAMSDITVTDDTGSINMVSLSTAAGPNRQLTITVNEQGNVKVKITKAGITAEEKTVEVFKKLGFVDNPDAEINEVVTFGLPTEGPNITFASNDGKTIAILPPRTSEPVSSMSAASPGLEQVLATFDPPVSLVDAAIKFRWFDMVWDNFGTSWDFEAGKFYLHQVHFQLDLTTSDDKTVRFQKMSETNTTNGEKNPVRFELANVIAPSDTNGLTAWGTGHQVKAITLRVYNVQLRNDGNSAWPSISDVRAPTFDDMWISSLSAEMSIPPVPKVLYSVEDGWLSTVKKPSSSWEEVGQSPVQDLTVEPVTLASGGDGVQLIVYWDPIDIRSPDTEPYTNIIVRFTGGSPGWYGYGSIWMDGAYSRKNQQFNGNGGTPANGFRIPLTGSVYNMDNPNYFPEKFMGFFVQFNAVFTITITEIRLE